MSTAQHTADPRGQYRSYVTGFVLAIILTAIPFWMVMEKVAAPSVLLPAILVIGAVQMLVHLKYFLHLTGADGKWNIGALFLTVLIVFIVLAGTLWVMSELNSNMMPWMSDMHHSAHGAMQMK